jgi:hypothetical protein
MKKLISLFTFISLVVYHLVTKMMNQLQDKVLLPSEMLMGSNEVPTNNSTMGTAILKFNNTTKIFTITVTQRCIYYIRTHP